MIQSHFKRKDAMKITNFFKGLKRAAEFFDLNPYGFSINEQKRSEQVEKLNAIVSYVQSMTDRHVGLIGQLERQQKELEKEKIKLTVKIDGLERQITTSYKPSETVTNCHELNLKKLKNLEPVKEKFEKIKSSLTQKEIKSFFEYRDGLLFWKKRRSGNALIGSLAGTERAGGYRSLYIYGKHYTYGRIIFCMFNGYMPERVRYKDHDPSNSRIENLEESNRSLIMGLRKLKKSSGIYKRGDNKYNATITKMGKSRFLGVFNTEQDAQKAWNEARDILFKSSK